MGRSHWKASSLLSQAHGRAGQPRPILALRDAGSGTGREEVAEEGASLGNAAGLVYPEAVLEPAQTSGPAQGTLLPEGRAALEWT